MELTELKDRIEKYFKEVDPDELYELVSSKWKKRLERTSQAYNNLRESLLCSLLLMGVLLRTKNWCLKNSYIS